LAGVGTRLVQLAGGRATPAGNIHLTLAFLGEVAAARVPLLHRIAGEARGRRFRLALDRVGSFRRARVAWAGADQPPRQLMALQAELSGRLRENGFELEERGYSPHATLARKIERAVPRARIEVIEWPVAEYALVESAAGRYTTLASWRLG
jgi:RNA 2',3'-cyclic 3'-phosphodiesterase